MFSSNKSDKKYSYKTSNKDSKSVLLFSKTQEKLFFLSILFLAIYIIMSIYTPWAGSLGNKISSYLLTNVGGAIVVLLLFISYVALLKLFSRAIPYFRRQIVATILFFLNVSLLLGLYVLTNDSNKLHIDFLNPGDFGIKLSRLSFTFLGAAGTFLLGFISIYISLILYGIKPYIKLPYVTKLLQMFIAKINKIIESVKYLFSQKPITHTNKLDSKSAPNITDFDKNNYDYFDVKNEETRISFDEKQSITQLQSEEQEDLQVLDPAFNLNTEQKNKVKLGIFPPPIEIFGNEESNEGEMDQEKATPFGKKIIQTLNQFGIEAFLADILVGPTVIQFRIQLAPGIKVNKVAALGKDIALAIAVPSLRIEAPIPGKPYIGIEIPNPIRRGIPLRTVISDHNFQNSKHLLPLPFGVGVNGGSVVVGLEKLPHLLVSGTTGSGKSVFINSCIVALCSTRTPDELRMILVDPKRVEMTVYDKLPHLLTPPVTDTKKAVHVLAWAIREMEKRYSTFADLRVRNLEDYNKKVREKDRLPFIVLIVDELADLMMTAPKEVEDYICRLSQMARATGIHLILATQRPSVNVITGLIKANIPARVAFTLPSNADSRTIIDCAGAEKLLGKGDMLFLSTKHPKPIRIQAPWIEDSILSNWLNYLQNTFGEPEFIEITARSSQIGGQDEGYYEDDLLEEAIEIILNTGIASASGLQRRLRVGFSRASRLIDMMEQLGIVGGADGPKPREILVDERKAKDLFEERLS